MINHAYTLALHHTGQHQQLSDVAFRIGNALISTDPASALDYFQRSLQAGLDFDRARLVAEIHNEWAGARTPLVIRTEVPRVAHLVTNLNPNEATTEYVRMLVRGLNSRGVESTVFTTEANAAWFLNPTAKPTSSPEIKVAGQVVIAPLQGDFFERADRISRSIQDTAVSVVFHHTRFSDQIAARVAVLRPAPVQIQVAPQPSAHAALFDGAIHFPASDIEDRLRTATFETRESLGLPANVTVSASFSGPFRSQMDFVKSIIQLMQRFPSHVHLFAGAGEVRVFRSLLHSEGVLPRMRFLGSLTDFTRLFRVIDVCLVPFPEKGAATVLEFMGARKPVVALRQSGNSEKYTAAELIGVNELSPETINQYFLIADRLIRNENARAEFGERLHKRFVEQFTAAQMAERYIRFLETLRTA
jgi:glycosyltransferase involved in cell wall biosynthesis